MMGGAGLIGHAVHVARPFISEGQSHFFKGCPSKDFRISIIVPDFLMPLAPQFGMKKWNLGVKSRDIE